MGAPPLGPRNTTDVKSLVPVVERLRQRFHVGQVCIVADRGMISEATLAELEERGWKYILGVRMRNVKNVRDQVLRRSPASLSVGLGDCGPRLWFLRG